MNNKIKDSKYYYEMIQKDTLAFLIISILSILFSIKSIIFIIFEIIILFNKKEQSK